MSRLPFVVQPKKNTEIVRIGNDSTGVLEIERRGYLTVAEKSFVDNVMQGSDGVTQMVVLANRLSRENKISAEEAYIIISEVMQGQGSSDLHEKIASEFGDQISEITTKMTDSLQRRAIAVTTILIQSRIDHEWSVEDTMGLDPELLIEFSNFYDKEEQRIPVEAKDTKEEVAEILGK